jgi:LysM repeat protein
VRSDGNIGIRSSVAGASRTSEDFIEATRNGGGGSSLDAAFNAGMDGDDFESSADFGEFDNIAPIDPIQPATSGPSVSVSGPSLETYTVKKGDSLWAISKRYSISLNELYAANGLNKTSVLKIGQQIQIPVEGGSAMVNTVTADAYQPSSFNTSSESYTVKPGDTLSKIANQFDTSVRSIKAANSKTSDMIRVGEKLLIPAGQNATGSTGSSTSSFSAPSPRSTPSVSSVAASATSSGRTHQVQAGEFPATIARKYGMTSGELLALNGITDPRSLQIGQVLNVNASGSSANVDSRTETFSNARSTTLIPAAVTPAPVANRGPVQIRVVEADPLVEGESDIIDVDSQFDNAVEIPVIRLEE